MTVIGDARRLPFADGVAQCVVTSPPYYGLRDYGVTGQIGLEQTPAAYVAEIVATFREVRRVLRDDGVAWLNIGDSYATRLGGDGWGDYEWKTGGSVKPAAGTVSDIKRNRKDIGAKSKDLLGIPWRVAFALQADGAASPETMRVIQSMISAITGSYDSREEWPDKIAAEVERLEREYVDANAGGWYLRSDCIWHKPNPMPESVTDRPTKAHEYVFLLAKEARYFYDADAVAEAGTTSGKQNSFARKANTCPSPVSPMQHRPDREDIEYSGTRNARTVWTFATQPYSGAHFATMPPKLAERCILAGTSQRGACPKCGAAWVRVVIVTGRTGRDWNKNNMAGGDRLVVVQSASDAMPDKYKRETIGWRPACDCAGLGAWPALPDEPEDGPDDDYRAACAAVDAQRAALMAQYDLLDVRPCIVLDPFSGSGTTERVSISLGRRFIGTELNARYVHELRAERTATVQVRGL